MRTPKKLDIYEDIPKDIKRLVKAIAKRFSQPGLNLFHIKRYLHSEALKEAYNATGYDVRRTAKYLGVKYHTVYMHVYRRNQLMRKEFNVGEAEHD